MAATNNGTPAPKLVRCAIYTRKSTEEGLNQEFNSLDAQREAAEAYILSQKHDGWTLVPTQYSDGGYTGANIERPGVKQLLADIEDAKIDCVVVYKVDRLSRSLIDFSKMMELFEKHGVCFVSVTQQFNTNSSLGRLTLNILLSFAQFEREIISERTRDKQVAARKKGKWTGGHILMGYDLDSRGGKLTVNLDEAERVREMFRLYLEGTQVTEIVQRFDKLGWRNKQWTTQDGKLYGGSPLRRCHIYKLLGNILYTGQVKVGDEVFPGEHEAIIDQQTFDLAQKRLKENAWTPGNEHRVKFDALLRGLIYCSCCGSGMYSTYSANKERRYRYYVCYRSQQKLEGYCTSRSVSAPSVEEAVVESIRRVGVHPDVLAETARAARQRLAEIVSGLREELNTTNGRVKNLKSQIARIRNPEAARLAEIREQLDAGETRAEDLRKEILRREKQRIDEKELRRTMESFEDVWKAMNLEEQRTLLRQLVEKVGYDGRTGTVTVSFKSAGVKELVQKEAVR
ncbi:MAG: recombinase family protein [Acidobacteria bacterium]|nr:recombinase family protein [Acidobacteriota bacterium]